MAKKGMILLAAALALFLSACGRQEGSRLTDGSEAYAARGTQKAAAEEPEEESSEGAEKLFAVTALDEAHKILTLYDYGAMREKPYSYDLATYVHGKYGDSLTVGQLAIGELVTIETKGEKLADVTVSEDAFSYGNVHEFTIDREEKTLEVGGTTYFYGDDVLAFQDARKIPLSEISTWDTICLRGVDRQVYTIQVLTGHGTVALLNTELFQGGYITIGNMVAMKITPQMRIEVAEGTHLLSVANDGYGGSRQVTVEANKETKVDLNELKGEGPKFGEVQVTVSPGTAAVYLDGEQADVSRPLEVRYGAHVLEAKAEGYEDWKKIIVVSSDSSQVDIEMTKVGEDSTAGNGTPAQ